MSRKTDEIIRMCKCGCGKNTNPGRHFIVGHSMKGRKLTDEQKIHHSNAVTKKHRKALSIRAKTNNPMFKESAKAKFRGDKNPAKRLEVRALISKNNAMNNPAYKLKATINHRRSIKNNPSIRFAYSNWAKQNPDLHKLARERQIETYTQRLSEGKYQIKNNWKTGWFTKSDGTKEWYDSSYEKIRMQYYEDNNIQWTKKHCIRIPYINDDSVSTYYVPDFLIVENGKQIIEEIKGWMKNKDTVKAKIAIDYCKARGWSYRFYLGSTLTLIKELSVET